MASVEKSYSAGDPESPYRGRAAALATMHGKQDAIAPVLHTKVGLTVHLAEGMNTDSLGTFTGEVPRHGMMKQVAVAKARLGMSATGLPIGLASEGTYGPHPYIPFIAGGMELLVLVDDERGIIVAESLIDDNTNFSHVITDSMSGMGDFLTRARFPSHGLVVGPNKSASPEHQFFKAIKTPSELENAIARSASASLDARALVQTDMRAHQNPTRMAAIRRLSDSLAERLLSLCPTCASPGFGLTGTMEGLPCEYCGGPSTLVHHQVFGCVSCEHAEKRPRPDGLLRAEQVWCSICNP